jgi:muramidase (phage lysozyme)
VISERFQTLVFSLPLKQLSRRLNYLIGFSLGLMLAIGAASLSQLNTTVFSEDATFLNYLGERAEAAPPINSSEQLSPAALYWLTTEPFISMLALGEGTHPEHPAMIKAGITDPYRVIYSYAQAKNYEDHPRRSMPIYDANGNIVDWSDAAGLGQFLSTTYDGLHDIHSQWCEGEQYFSPCNQDQALLYLHSDTGADAALQSGVKVDGNNHITVSYDAFRRAVYLDSSQWASFPGYEIGKSTGQRNLEYWELWTIYQWQLWKRLGYLRPIQHPVPKYKNAISSRAGDRTINGVTSTHYGQDHSTPAGTPVLAPEYGTVTDTGYEPNGGYYSVFTPTAYPELELVSRHLQKENRLPAGREVKPGEPMAFTGNSGEHTTGDHWHCEVLVDGGYIDPYYYLGMASWYAPATTKGEKK